MKQRICTLILILLTTSYLTILAQKKQQTDYVQTLRGTVIEKSTKEPLPGATIVVITGDKEVYASTDEKGEFSFKNIPVGRCNVSISMLGFSPYIANSIVVYSGRETVLEVVLEEMVNQLEEVVVRATVNKEQPLNKLAVVSARMLSNEEANRYAGSWGDPSRMVANFAGVAQSADMRNDIIVRGNSPTGVQWRLDGFEIPNPNHFGAMGGTGGPVGMLNNNQLANSDFYTGGFPAEFGNVTAGLFDLRLRNGNNQKHEFTAGMGFNGLEVGAEGPLSKKTGASYMINARYSFLKIMEKVGINFGTGGTPEYQDVTSKINIPLKKGNLSWVTMLGKSRIHYYSETEKDPDYKPEMRVVNQHVLMNNNQVFTGVNYTHRFNVNTRLENRVAYQRFARTLDNKDIGYPQKDTSVSFSGKEIEAQYDLSSNLFTRINVRNSIKTGVGVAIYNTDLKNVYRETFVLQDFNDYSTLLKGFTQWHHRFSDNLSLTAGVYGQYYTLNKDYSIEPRAGIKWVASTNTSFSLGGGMYSQLQPRQVYFYRKDGVERNRDLKMNRNWQIVFGYNQKIGKQLHLKTEIYYQYLYSIAVMENSPAESILNMGDGFYNNWDDVLVNKGYGKNYGIEVTLEKYFDNNYYFLLTGSLYDSRYKGYDGIERHTKFAGHFALNGLMGYEWKLGKDMLLSVNGKCAYIGGKRYVPLSMQSHGDYTPDYTQAYTHRLPDYFRIDLNVAMKQNFHKWSMEWFFEAGNLTNHKNIAMKYYDEVLQKEKYMYQSGFMPMGGCRVYF